MRSPVPAPAPVQSRPLRVRRAAGKPRIVLCYFLSADCAGDLLRAATALSPAAESGEVGPFECHCFSDPPLRSTDSRVVGHAKSRVDFRALFERCDAVACSAGNETVWEAVSRGVRVLAVPTPGHAEQVLNARAHAANFPSLVRASSRVDADGLRWLLQHEASDGGAAAAAAMRAAVGSLSERLESALDPERSVTVEKLSAS